MLTLLAISGTALLYWAIWLIVALLIIGLLFWLIDYAGVPAPFNKIAKVVLAIIGVIIVINALLGLTGSAFIKF